MNHLATTQILVGDCRDSLVALPAESVHCVVTSPPYWGLRDYGLPPSVWGGDPACEHEWGEWASGPSSTGGTPKGLDGGEPWRSTRFASSATASCARCGAWRGVLGLEPTLDQYLANLVAVFAAVRRVLRADGTVWLNLGDCYTSGGRTYRDADERNEGRGMDYRAQTPTGIKPKDLVLLPHRVALALQADGWWIRQDIVWHKPNPLPESVTDRPSRAHEYVFLLAKNQDYFYDADAVREPHSADSLARVERGRSDHHKWADGGPGGQTLAQDISQACHPSGRNMRSVLTIPSQPLKEAHFAAFPEALVTPCILAGTSDWGCCPNCGAPWERVTEDTLTKAGHGNNNRARKGAPGDSSEGARPYDVRMLKSVQTTGWRQTCTCPPADPIPCTVLDPFAGSGTTMRVANRLGRSAIGCELKPEYAAMARRRTAQPGLGL